VTDWWTDQPTVGKRSVEVQWERQRVPGGTVRGQGDLPLRGAVSETLGRGDRDGQASRPMDWRRRAEGGQWRRRSRGWGGAAGLCGAVREAAGGGGRGCEVEVRRAAAGWPDGRSEGGGQRAGASVLSPQRRSPAFARRSGGGAVGRGGREDGHPGQPGEELRLPA
jgi:hypothetical protein